MLATVCTWPLVLLQQQKAGGSLNHCALYLKQAFQAGAKKMLFGEALKNYKRGPAACKNFPLPAIHKVETFSIFWLIRSPRTLHLVLSTELTINNSFLFHFYGYFQAFISLGAVWRFFFFWHYIFSPCLQVYHFSVFIVSTVHHSLTYSLT